MAFLRMAVAVLAAALLSTPVLAHDAKVGDIEIAHPWARATAEGAPTGVVYLVLSNEGKVADRLIAASSPAAAKVELHTHTMDNGVMKMQEVTVVDLAAGASVALAPNGLHVMLIGLKEPLTQGHHFPLTLTFEKAGPVSVTVSVQGAGDTKFEHEGTGDHDHDHDHDHGHDH